MRFSLIDAKKGEFAVARLYEGWPNIKGKSAVTSCGPASQRTASAQSLIQSRMQRRRFDLPQDKLDASINALLALIFGIDLGRLA
jgi:hypothetical protein